MAGTRLFLSIVYLIEIPLLIYIAFRHAVANSRSIKTKWYPTHQPILPHRSGVSLLERENLDASLSQLSSRFSMMEQKVIADIYLRFLGKDGAEIDAEYKDRAFMALLDGLEIHKHEARAHNDSYVNLHLHNVDHSNDESISNCDEVSNSFFGEHLNKDERYARGYHLFVAVNCDTSNIDVSENGSMLVRFERGIAEDDILILLKTHVSPLVHELLYTRKTQRHSFPTRASRLLISLVDPNPSSHATNLQSAIEHHARLNDSFIETMEDTLVPMIGRLSQYVDISIATPQSLPYYGQDLSSRANQNEYDDGTVDYSISIKEAKEILMYGDLAQVTQRAVTSAIEEDLHVDIIHIVLFIADGEATPMFAESAGRWSRAFSLPSNNLVVALVNVPKEIDFSNNEEYEGTIDEISTIELDKHYKYEMKRALSYAGTFLRTHYGLESQQPHDVKSEESAILPIRHERVHNGVAQWELDRLVRETVHMKAKEVLESLKQTNELIQMRSRLSITMEVSPKC